MFKSLWHTPVKVTLTVLALIGAYGWMSADDWAVELEEEQAKINLAQQLQALPPVDPEAEPNVTPVEVEPVPPTPIARATNTVKKAAVKTKKRVKKALKPKQ